MKNMIKTAAVSAFIAVMCCACAGGINIGSLAGEWHVTEAGGVSIEEYAAAHGMEPSFAAVDVVISGNEYTSTSGGVTQRFGIEGKSGGFDLKSEDGSAVVFVKYDSGADTLTYSVKINGETTQLVLTRK